MKRWSSFVAALAVFVVPVLAEAQSVPGDSEKQKSHWGVAVNFAPSWTVQENLKILFDAKRVDVQGSDFEVGFVRGRDLGGDWGVSFVRKSFKSGSVVDRSSQNCFLQFCGVNGSRYILKDVSLTGVSIHKYVPFATIKRRAQIGMNFGGGVAQVKGQAEQHILRASPVFDRGPRGVIGITQTETVAQVEGRKIFAGAIKTLPLAKVEVAAAAILAPGLKVRGGWGLNFPASYKAWNMTVSYLFGAK